MSEHRHLGGRRALEISSGKGIMGASQVALVVKNPSANAGDIRHAGSVPGLGRSPGGRHGNPLQYACLQYSWRIPWTVKPGGLQSIRLQSVGHN